MPQVRHDILVFDHFSLDLTRGCLRAGHKDLVLSPKAFHTLRHLAENAGRLVSKQELHDAVWGKISVSDDSIVQCVRELRLKLGDDQRSLIKTVPRRGYLLDALPERLEEAFSPKTSVNGAVGIDPRPEAPARRGPIKYQPWIGIGLLVLGFAMATVVTTFAGWAEGRFSSMLNTEKSLFSEADAKRLVLLGLDKQLPIPSFQIPEPGSTVPDRNRRFIGVWVSDTGWVNSDRQFMMIVTRVGQNGVAEGFLVNGPSMPQSHVQSPAFSGRFTGAIVDGVLRYDGNAGMHLASLKSDGQIEFKLTFNDGHVAVVSLAPFWTLSAISLKTAGPASR